MKITYESGDVIELDDDVDVPFSLGASFIKLEQKKMNNKWTFEFIDSVGGLEVTPPSGATLDEKWFNPA